MGDFQEFVTERRRHEPRIRFTTPVTSFFGWLAGLHRNVWLTLIVCATILLSVYMLTHQKDYRVLRRGDYLYEVLPDGKLRNTYWEEF